VGAMCARGRAEGSQRCVCAGEGELWGWRARRARIGGGVVEMVGERVGGAGEWEARVRGSAG
jgi:hypothetical protein